MNKTTIDLRVIQLKAMDDAEDDELYNDCVKIFKRTVKDDECYY